TTSLKDMNSCSGRYLVQHAAEIDAQEYHSGNLNDAENNDNYDGDEFQRHPQPILRVHSLQHKSMSLMGFRTRLDDRHLIVFRGEVRMHFDGKFGLVTGAG